MKRQKKIRVRSKASIAKIQRKLWVYCKLLTRRIHGNTCYTCDAKNLESGNWQTGHLIPKSVCNPYLKYDLRILRPQCANCNIWNGGMGAEYLRRMIVREGQEYVDQIYRDRALKVNPYEHYLMLIEKYKLMLEERLNNINKE